MAKANRSSPRVPPADVSGHSKGCKLRSGRGGIIADVLAGKDAIDGLLNDPDQVDGLGVERARPGVGVEDLSLEGQPVERISDSPVDRSGLAILDFQRVQGLEQLADAASVTGSPRRSEARKLEGSSAPLMA